MDWRLYRCCWDFRLLLFVISLILILLVNLGAVRLSSFAIRFALVAYFFLLVLFALWSCCSSFHVSSTGGFENRAVDLN